MRFDLTVPFARFAAQHIPQLGTPFKRYHIAPVWRGERPARGRFREFLQCDFDTIGTESLAADIETVLVIHDLLETIGLGEFTIHVNHRQLLNGVLEHHGLLDRTVPLLRALDKLPKIGEEKVIDEMKQTAQVNDSQAQAVLDLAALKGEAKSVLEQARPLAAQSQRGALALDALEELTKTCQEIGLASNRLHLDLSIARGLDYYTGTIFETFLDDLPGIGSVCSGGRYDDLAGLFTKQKLPGVGASLGLDRLLAAMDELGQLEAVGTTSQVLITQFDTQHLTDYQKLSRRLHQAGVASEVYPEAKAIGKQLKYANKKKIPLAIIAGDEEFQQQAWQLKDLNQGTQTIIENDQIVEKIRLTLDLA